jgi:hypothetical protein
VLEVGDSLPGRIVGGCSRGYALTRDAPSHAGPQVDLPDRGARRALERLPRRAGRPRSGGEKPATIRRDGGLVERTILEGVEDERADRAGAQVRPHEGAAPVVDECLPIGEPRRDAVVAPEHQRRVRNLPAPSADELMEPDTAAARHVRARGNQVPVGRHRRLPVVGRLAQCVGQRTRTTPSRGTTQS